MIALDPEIAAANPGLLPFLANIDLIDAGWRQIVRDDFGYFRQHMRPTMMWGFWNEVVAAELTEFYNDFVAGKRPKIVICTPPQHGKSWTAVDFIGWVSGRDPDLKTIFASFSANSACAPTKICSACSTTTATACCFPRPSWPSVANPGSAMPRSWSSPAMSARSAMSPSRARSTAWS
jgi:hypothetical protein